MSAIQIPVVLFVSSDIDRTFNNFSGFNLNGVLQKEDGLFSMSIRFFRRCGKNNAFTQRTIKPTYKRIYYTLFSDLYFKI
jgi:hypothetical protein